MNEFVNDVLDPTYEHVPMIASASIVCRAHLLRSSLSSLMNADLRLLRALPHECPRGVRQVCVS